MPPTKNDPLLIVVTGPTATGKTRTAAHLAKVLDGEIISADSRQVYRGMDVGSGKDLDDFMVDDYLVPYHLVDIVEPGYEYNLFEFIKDFSDAFSHIRKREKQPILCGGTGMYIEAVLKGYSMQKVPVNNNLRRILSTMTFQELTKMLVNFRPLHNTSDTTDRDRLIRAIEIETYQKENPREKINLPSFRHIIFGIHFEREVIRQRISDRLEARLNQGMVEEIHELLKKGIKPHQLTFYGLEYRYLTLYVTGEISYQEMVNKLTIAIHQFSKRQMTWFRRMERNDFKIHWINGNLDMNSRIDQMRMKIFENH